MPPKTKHQPSKAARDRVSQQMQVLDARIKRSPYEQGHQHRDSASLSRFVLNVGTSIRVNFVVADRGRTDRDEVLTFVSFLASVSLLLGVLAIAGYGVWRIFIPMMSECLGLPIALSTIILIASIIHFEGYDGSRRSGWRWGLQYLNLPLVRVSREAYYLGINLIGGAMPVAIALYQLTRISLPVALSVALPVIGLVAIMGYFSARVVPMVGIFLADYQTELIALAAALFSTALLPDTIQPLEASIAFSGCVIGSLIGVDLLHLKDLRLKALSRSTSIGGAGLRDGILRVGLMSLFIAEYFPTFVGWISHRTGLIIHYPTAAIFLGLLLTWPISRGCYKSYVWTLSKGTSPDNLPLHLSTIAASYVRKGRYKKGEKLYKQVIALGEPRSAEDCHYKINSLIELAFLYDKQARFKDAELAYQQGISLARQYAAGNPLELITLLFHFAQLCEWQKRYAEANRFYTEVLVWIGQLIKASIAGNNLDIIIQETQRRLATLSQYNQPIQHGIG